MTSFFVISKLKSGNTIQSHRLNSRRDADWRERGDLGASRARPRSRPRVLGTVRQRSGAIGVCNSLTNRSQFQDRVFTELKTCIRAP